MARGEAELFGEADAVGGDDDRRLGLYSLAEQSEHSQSHSGGSGHEGLSAPGPYKRDMIHSAHGAHQFVSGREPEHARARVTDAHTHTHSHATFIPHSSHTHPHRAQRPPANTHMILLSPSRSFVEAAPRTRPPTLVLDLDAVGSSPVVCRARLSSWSTSPLEGTWTGVCVCVCVCVHVRVRVCNSLFQNVASFCRVLQGVACRVLQCVAVCCNAEAVPLQGIWAGTFVY